MLSVKGTTALFLDRLEVYALLLALLVLLDPAI